MKIKELKTALENSKKQDLSKKHITEMSNLEALYKKEYEELDVIYNNKFYQLEMKSKQLEENLNIRHQEEMKKFYVYFEEKLPNKVKHSKKFLDLKTAEINLAKQQKYNDALIVKKKCDEIEAEDYKRFNKEKTDKFKAYSIKNANKHLGERNSLKRKIELEYEELKKDKTKQLEILIMKFKNKKAELESQQKMEKIVVENKNLFKASKYIEYLMLFHFRNNDW